MSDVLANHPRVAVLALILGFGFLVLVHELGHFLVAKWAGIRATQFAIGFGPAIASFRKGLGVRPGSTEAEYEKRARAAAGENPTEDELYAAADAEGLGETEYRLNWLPLGGYVKMLGQEDLDPAAASQDPRAYNRKPIWKRMAVISAGVVMNLIFGILFLVGAFAPGSGVAFPAPVVGGVQAGEPASTAYANGHEGDPAYQGLLPGDTITELNGEPVEDMIAVRIATALGGRGNTIGLTIDRPGVEETLRYDLRPRVGRFSDQMLAVGLSPAETEEVAGVAETGVWADAGIGATDRLVSVGGTPVAGPAALQRALASAGPEPIELVFESPDGEAKPVTIRPEPAFARGPDGGESLLGLEPLAEVMAVDPDLPAAVVGLQPGDLLVRVGNTDWPTREGVFAAIGDARDAKRPVELAVLRGGKRLELPAAELDDGMLGISFGAATGSTRVARTDPGDTLLLSAAGSRILAINDQPVSSFADIQQRLEELAAAAAPTATDDRQTRVLIRYESAIGTGREETASLGVTPAELAILARSRWRAPDGLFFQPLKVLIAGDNLVDAAGIGLVKTGEFIQQTYVTLLRLFTGDVKVTHLRGPVGIVDEGSKISRGGWPYYFYFLGIISINLAVINFLPLPIVDGGHMVFLAVEKLRGKPAGPQVQTAVALVGLCLIAAFFLVVTFNDLSRLFG